MTDGKLCRSRTAAADQRTALCAHHKMLRFRDASARALRGVMQIQAPLLCLGETQKLQQTVSLLSLSNGSRTLPRPSGMLACPYSHQQLPAELAQVNGGACVRLVEALSSMRRLHLRLSPAT